MLKITAEWKNYRVNRPNKGIISESTVLRKFFVFSFEKT
jgi:hypothetical protein